MKKNALLVIAILALSVLIAGCGDLLSGSVVNPTTPSGQGVFTPEAPETPNAPQTPSANDEPSDTDVIDQEPIEVPEPENDFDGVVLTFTEGDLIELTPEAIDPDGDKVTYEFGEPLSREGKWQTDIGDEGRYLIPVVASDGKLKTEENVLLIVHRANRAPTIDCDDEAVLHETERFYVYDYCEIFDEDEEEVVVQYRGWPGYSRYVTTYDDAGMHSLLIIANDKTHVVKHELPIRVLNKNRQPVFNEAFPEMLVGSEGDVLTLDKSLASDPDGDELTWTFSEPFNDKGIWRTDFGDAGNYNIDVVVSDGEASIKRTVSVELQLANTKPVLKEIADIEVDEGETIRLPISASDREGDDLRVKISGWMTTDTYTTTYDDAGEYTVTITVSDGELETSKIVHITVNNVNRPPYFIEAA